MVRRPANASAFADVYVFPGGTVREDDFTDKPNAGAFSAEDALAALSQRGGIPPANPGQALALWRAAIRELFEEAGVLIARDPTGRPFQVTDADAPRFAEHRTKLQSRELSLAALLNRETLQSDDRKLCYFSHWITPAHLTHRFDTRFFVAKLPEGQTALHCQIETTEGRWISPGQALTLADAGQFGIVFPTRKHLERLNRRSSVDDLLDFAARKPIRTIQPVLRPIDGAERITLDGEVGECW